MAWGGIKDIWWLVSEVQEIWGLGGFDEESQAAGCVQQPMCIHVTNSNLIFAKWNK